MKKSLLPVLSIFTAAVLFGITGCKPKNAGNAAEGDAASKVYVAPGKYDEL